MDFELIHDKGRLIAVVKINGNLYEKDVTSQFEESNAFDEWLDYRLKL